MKKGFFRKKIVLTFSPNISLNIKNKLFGNSKFEPKQIWLFPVGVLTVVYLDQLSSAAHTLEFGRKLFAGRFLVVCFLFSSGKNKKWKKFV